MKTRNLILSLATLASLAAGPQIQAQSWGSGMAVRTVQSQSMRFGPFATMRRANEVANYFRSLGFGAQVYNGGNYEYYVNVW